MLTRAQRYRLFLRDADWSEYWRLRSALESALLNLGWNFGGNMNFRRKYDDVSVETWDISKLRGAARQR